MAYRPDRSSVVYRWDEVVAEARKGGVALSLAGPHAALSFLSICAAFGEPPAVRDPKILVSEALGAEVFDVLSSIYAHAEKSVLALNPIGILAHMATHDDVRLVPLVYGYVNYTQLGLKFADAPKGYAGIGSALGGTGIGISTRCRVTPELLTHLRWLLSETAQQSYIPAHDGQPSRRSAWHDPAVNAAWGDFYSTTAQTLESAYVRPRYSGYIAWQSAASEYLRDALANGLSGREAARTLNRLHTHKIGDRQR
jgi:multiple sugar transport system substrate-binding protein